MVRGGKELKLDVVGVAEDENRAVGFVGDRGLCQRLVGRVGAHDAVGFEVLLPGSQVGAIFGRATAREDYSSMQVQRFSDDAFATTSNNITLTVGNDEPSRFDK